LKDADRGEAGLPGVATHTRCRGCERLSLLGVDYLALNILLQFARRFREPESVAAQIRRRSPQHLKPYHMFNPVVKLFFSFQV